MSEITVYGIMWPRAPHERIGVALTPNEATSSRTRAGVKNKNGSRPGYDFNLDWNNVYDRIRDLF